MNKKEYNKLYKQHHYNKTRKIVSFPILNKDYETLFSRAKLFGLTPNTFTKEIVLNFLESKPHSFITEEEHKQLREFIRISRGIATNINQLAYKANIGEFIDINILAKQLKKYEDEFQKFVVRR